MDEYCINRNAQDNGDHEVHNVTKGCDYLPQPRNRIPLGYHSNCFSAIRKAKEKGFYTANGCYYCANPCHKS